MGVSTVFMRLSTANQYGLLEMKMGEGYKPTPLFTSLYKPLNENEKKEAQLKCLSNSELHSKLIIHYNGKQLPALGGLGILLYRSYKVSEDASSKAAKIFLDNLSEVGLIGENNNLNGGEIVEEPPLKNNIKSAEEFTYVTEPIRKQIEAPINLYDITTPVGGSFITIPAFLKGNNRMAKVLLPVDFTNEDLDQIAKVLTANKRPE